MPLAVSSSIARPTVRHAPFLLVVHLLLLALAACSGTGSADGVAAYTFALIEEPRNCPKDEQLVFDYLDEQRPAKTCVVDLECDCGMNCNENGFCTAKCVTADHEIYDCPSGQVCDNWGQCVPPPPVDGGAPPPPPPPAPTVAVMTVSPVSIELPAPASATTPFATQEVQVVLSTDDNLVATNPLRQPRITVTGGQVTPPACSDSDPATECTIAPATELEVACTAGAAFAKDCTFDPPYSFLAPPTVPGAPPVPAGTPVVKRAERTVWVRPVTGAHAGTWDLIVSTDAAANVTQRVSLTEIVNEPQPFAGRYKGAIELEGTANAQPVRVPVRAEAQNGALVLVDDTHLVSPSGRLRLEPDAGAQRSTWIGSGSDFDVVVEILAEPFVHDAAHGRLSGRFTVRLPEVGTGVAVPASTTLAWRFALDREAPLAGASCNPDGPSTCPATQHCEPALATCLPGPLWQPAPVATPVNQLAHDGLLDNDGSIAWTQLGLAVAQRLSPDVAERLLCYVPGADKNLLALGETVMARSGELKCATGLPPTANKLPYLRDTNDSQSIGDLFTSCLTDLTPPSAIDGSHPCIDLAQVYPAVSLLVLGPATDRRSGLLLQQVLRAWMVTHAFLARQGLEVWRLQSADAGEAEVELPALLDKVSQGWRLILDAGVVETLAALRPELLRDPDHRGSNRPYAYFPLQGVTDTEGGPNLTISNGSGGSLPPGYGWIPLDPETTPLGRDLTVTFKAGMDWFDYLGPRRMLVESPELSIRFEDTYGPKQERGFTRVGTVANVKTGVTWWKCSALCVDSSFCQTWSWEPSSADSGTCTRFNNLSMRVDVRTSKPNARSGVIRYYTESASNQVQEPNDGFDRFGSDLQMIPTLTWEACRTACDSNTYSLTCRAWTFTKNDKKCWMKGYDPLPLKRTGVNITSGLSKNGKRIEYQLADYEPETDYTGNDLSSFAAPYWDKCHDACVANAQCKNWVWSTAEQRCWLKSKAQNKITVGRPNSISGFRRVIQLVVSHRSRSGKLETVTFPISESLHLNPQSELTLVRRAADKQYVLYVYDPESLAGPDAPLVLSASYTEAPYHDKLSVLAVGREGDPNGSNWAFVRDFAVFDSALDDGAVKAIHDRRKTASAMPVIRGPLSLPVSNDHDEHLGLPVTMLEGVESELGLLRQYLASRMGAVAGECHAHGATPVRDELLARTGDTLRQDAMVTALADALHERATWLGCRTDAACAPYAATCDKPATWSTTLRAADMAVSGTMKNNCWALWAEDGQGLCGPEGTGGTILPGSTPPGNATITFNVPTTGYYTLWARMIGRDSGSDSFWARMDAQSAPSIWELGANPNQDTWIWKRHPQFSYYLTAGPHTLKLGVRDDGAFLREVLVTSDLAGGPTTATDSVCIGADGKPIAQPTAWTSKFTDARAAMLSARADLLQSAADVAACKNPLGIEDSDLPLYFKDPLGNAGRYFASTEYLLEDLAKKAYERTNQLYGSARTIWLQKQNDEYQRQMGTLDVDRRVDLIAQSYESPLADLCGDDADQPGQLLATVDPATCFVVPSTQCVFNFQGPITSALPACYRGAMGEAMLGMKEAAFRVETSRQIWNAKQGEWERQSAFCVELEENQTLTAAHYETLASLRAKKAKFDKLAKFVGIAGAIGGMVASGVVTSNQLGQANDGSGSPGGSLGNGIGTLGGIASGLLSLFGPDYAQQIADEQARFEEEMALRSADQTLMLCHNQADAIRDAINTAALDMQHASTEFEQAVLRFANGRRKAEQLVQQGRGAVAREAGRTIAKPYFHYWLDETIGAYERELRWAKRLTYMALLAVEYDFQTSLPLRAAIIDASRPEELRQVQLQLEAVKNPFQVHGRSVSQKFVVMSLRKDILGFTGSAAEQTARLRDYMRDKSQRLTDGKGAIVGIAVRFALSEKSVTLPQGALAFRCGERVWSTTARISTSQTLPPARATLRLLKRNRFYSQWCGPASEANPYQVSTIRPTRNLFLPDIIEPFIQPDEYTRADIDAPVNGDVTPMSTQDNYSEGAVSDFAARGLYGEYTLSFPVVNGQTALDLSKIDDVYVRFDYLSAPDDP